VTAALRLAATPRTTVTLLDGGAQAYPRMLRAIGRARRAIHLEVYAFTAAGVGGQFVAALAAAARRGVAVRVELDGWGSVKDGRAIAATLTAAGCAVRIYHRLRALLRGRFGRNHRKLLVIDGRDAFIGGINIGDENLDGVAARGWADVAVELRGPAVARLARRLRHQAPGQGEAGVRIWLSGLGGGRRLRARYLAAIEGARRRIDLAHGYFLPDPGVVRALIAAAARGVRVRLLLAGVTDVPLARLATRRLHHRLLTAGVAIHEWRASVLHAKLATIDDAVLLIGSFNLDPFSLVNREALVEIADPQAVAQAARWLDGHIAQAPPITAAGAATRWQRWLLGPLGALVDYAATALGRLVSLRRHRRRRRPARRRRAPRRSA